VNAKEKCSPARILGTENPKEEEDMAMGVFGKASRSKGGEYWRSSVWWWHHCGRSVRVMMISMVALSNATKRWFLLLLMDLIRPRFSEWLSLEIDKVTIAIECAKETGYGPKGLCRRRKFLRNKPQ
jgi:hypothetical protein